MASIEHQENLKRTVEQAQRDALSNQEAMRAKYKILLDSYEQFTAKRVIRTPDKGEVQDQQDLNNHILELTNAKAAAYNSEWKICMLNYLAMLSSAVTLLNNSEMDLIYSARISSVQGKKQQAEFFAHEANSLSLEHLVNGSELRNGVLGFNSEKFNNNTNHLLQNSRLGSDFKENMVKWLKEEHSYTQQQDGTFSHATNGIKLTPERFIELKKSLINDLITPTPQPAPQSEVELEPEGSTFSPS